MNISDCLIDSHSPTNLLRFDQEAGTRLHEAQKPIRLIQYLIKLTSREGQVVLDPFMGSGTTAVAARELKRNFIGFEINPASWQTAEGRLNSMYPELRKDDFPSSAKGQLQMVIEQSQPYAPD